MIINLEKMEQRSLKHPAWLSSTLGVSQTIPIGTSQFALIQTRNAIYGRVEILSENSENLTVKYKTTEKRSAIDRTEIIKRKDIVVKRNYVN